MGMAFRDHFPALKQSVNEHPLIYLDNAATTQKPTSVIDTVTHFYTQQNANVHRGTHFLSAQATQKYEQARHIVERFIGGPIIWTRGTTEAINLVAQTWGKTQLARGDEIILTQMEHHANIVPWQLLQKECGFEIKVVPILSSGELDMAQFTQLLSSKTKLVSVTLTSNALGITNPINTLIEQAHQVGAKVLIDGAQAVAHQPINVCALGCDFFVFSGHKLFAPTGIGVLYAHEDCLANMPPYQGGGEMIENVSFTGTTFQKAPLRFEAGTPCIESALGLASAIEFLNQWDMSALYAHEQSLLDRLRANLEQAQLDITSFGDRTLDGQYISHKAPILAFNSAHMHIKDIASALDEQGIAVRAGHHCAMPLIQALNTSALVRIAFAPYNTHQEVDALTQALCSLFDQPQSISLPNEPSTKHFSLLDSLHQLPKRSERYRALIHMGKSLKRQPNIETDEYKIQGCESAVWIQCRNEDNLVYVQASGEANVINGLLALIVDECHQKPAQDVLKMDLFSELDALGLSHYLSPSRGNGVRAIIEHIKACAQNT